MKLSQYPAAIAQAAQAVNELDSQLAAVQLQINRLENNADKISAFEPHLKNDNQRKARRFEVLQVSLEYQQAINTMMRLTAEKANALTHLEYLRNQFSVAKLEVRQAIARQLSGTDALELIGA
jgi:chromosome segregation ATPase